MMEEALEGATGYLRFPARGIYQRRHGAGRPGPRGCRRIRGGLVRGPAAHARNRHSNGCRGNDARRVPAGAGTGRGTGRLRRAGGRCGRRVLARLMNRWLPPRSRRIQWCSLRPADSWRPSRSGRATYRRAGRHASIRYRRCVTNRPLLSPFPESEGASRNLTDDHYRTEFRLSARSLLRAIAAHSAHRSPAPDSAQTPHPPASMAARRALSAALTVGPAIRHSPRVVRLEIWHPSIRLNGAFSLRLRLRKHVRLDRLAAYAFCFSCSSDSCFSSGTISSAGARLPDKPVREGR